MVEEFTIVRNTKKKQTCKYCKKQGHSISNCWMLKSKNKAWAEYQKQQYKTKRQMESTNKNSNTPLNHLEVPNPNENYICPIFTSKN